MQMFFYLNYLCHTKKPTIGIAIGMLQDPSWNPGFNMRFQEAGV